MNYPAPPSHIKHRASRAAQIELERRNSRPTCLKSLATRLMEEIKHEYENDGQNPVKLRADFQLIGLSDFSIKGSGSLVDNLSNRDDIQETILHHFRQWLPPRTELDVTPVVTGDQCKMSVAVLFKD